jgi:hypothetical protein
MHVVSTGRCRKGGALRLPVRDGVNDTRRDFPTFNPHKHHRIIVPILALHHQLSWRNLKRTCFRVSPCKYCVSSSNANTNSYSEDAPAALSRNASAYNPLHEFVLPPGTDRHYSQQFADMYFLRLMQLKKTVKQRAEEAWRDFEVCNAILLGYNKLEYKRLQC